MYAASTLTCLQVLGHKSVKVTGEWRYEFRELLCSQSASYLTIKEIFIGFKALSVEVRKRSRF
jgi:hypothetical protein